MNTSEINGTGAPVGAFPTVNNAIPVPIENRLMNSVRYVTPIEGVSGVSASIPAVRRWE
jgi:hypothetical protein